MPEFPDFDDAIAWLLQGIINLAGFLVSIAVAVIEWLVMLFPASGPGLGIENLPSGTVSFSWVGYVVDFDALAALLAFVLAIETIWFLVGVVWRLWMSIKW